MNLRNPRKSYLFLQDEHLIAVYRNNEQVVVDKMKNLHIKNYAQGLHENLGPIRVFFKRKDMLWQEISWKDRNKGTMNRRPNLNVVNPDDILRKKLDLLALIGDM